ncbi:MAG: MarP family serine protease [Actinobacteria bacterium]|nr:MarP family serine protease [Actinomycetota bacterium]
MNLLDVIIIIALASAAFQGALAGAAVQVGFFTGFLSGMGAGAIIAPAVTPLFRGYVGQLLVTLLLVFGVATALAVVGVHVALHLRGQLREAGAGPADRAVGGGVAALALLVIMWVFTSALAAAPAAVITGQIHGSAVLNVVDGVLPPAPAVFAQLGRTFDVPGAPSLFTGLEPEPAEPVDLPSDAEVAAATDAGRRATVKVFGRGCPVEQQGSGFVAGPELVVTNAHVVTGASEVVIEGIDGRDAAVTVAFDADLDIAVLHVDGLATVPLELEAEPAERGATGAVLGFPLGTFRSEPAAVLRRFTAVGRDLYGSGRVRRDVYQLLAHMPEGGSGGPLLTSDGRVIGVAFSRSLRDPQVGYALTSVPVREMVLEASGSTPQTSTGRCLA